MILIRTFMDKYGYYCSKAIEEDFWRWIGKTLWSWFLTLIVMAYTWWCGAIEVYHVIRITKVWCDEYVYDGMIWLCGIWDHIEAMLIQVWRWFLLCFLVDNMVICWSHQWWLCDERKFSSYTEWAKWYAIQWG